MEFTKRDICEVRLLKTPLEGRFHTQKGHEPCTCKLYSYMLTQSNLGWQDDNKIDGCVCQCSYIICPVHQFQVATMISFLIYHSYLVELTPPPGLCCHDLALTHMALYQTSIKCQVRLGGGDAQILQGDSHLDSCEIMPFLYEIMPFLYEIMPFLCD